MTFDIALSRIRDPATSKLALLPGLALGLLVIGLLLLAARGVRAALQRAAGLRSMALEGGIVLGRIGSWGVSLVGLLVGASAIP